MCVRVSVWLVGMVSVWHAEAQLVCSCGEWGLGVNDRFERGFISPGFCSGMSLPSRWRDWM